MGLPRFAVVDVETSGLSVRRHHLLQIGLVTVDGDGTVVDRWSTLVRLRRPWSRVGPRKVHGITRRSLRGAPKASAALSELARRLDGAVFTAHNVEFDAAFLERAAQRHHVPLALERRLCTLQLSRRLDPDRLLTHGLSAVCERYDVKIERHHDALCDATATASVLPHLLAANSVAAAADLEPLYWQPRRNGDRPRPLFHLALRDEWEAAASAGESYQRSTIGRSLKEEGFIHCSFPDQVQATADRFYGGRDDVVLLTIDRTKLRADVIVEAVSPGGQRFPHLYGPLPLDAVTNADDVPVGPDGRLDLGPLLAAPSQPA